MNVRKSVVALATLMMLLVGLSGCVYGRFPHHHHGWNGYRGNGWGAPGPRYGWNGPPARYYGYGGGYRRHGHYYDDD